MRKQTASESLTDPVNSSVRIDLRSSWIRRSLLAGSPGCLSLCVIKTLLWSLLCLESLVLPIACGGKFKCFEIVFKVFHHWASLHLSPSFTFEFSPVTASARHTPACPTGKHSYLCAHTWATYRLRPPSLLPYLCPSLSPASEGVSHFKPILTSEDALGHPLITGSLSSDHQLAIPIDFLSTFPCVILKYWEDLHVQSEHNFLRKGLGRYILISLNLFRAQNTFGGAPFAKLPSGYPRKPIFFF